MERITSYRCIIRKARSPGPIIQGARVSVSDIVEPWKMGSSSEGIPAVYPHVTWRKCLRHLHAIRIIEKKQRRSSRRIESRSN